MTFKKNNIPWNKGLHIQCNTGRTHFKKGMKSHLKGKIYEEIYKEKSKKIKEKISISMKDKHNSIGTEFKKGCIPWSKGKRYKCPQISKALTGRKLTKEHIRNCLRRRIPSSLELKFLDIISNLKLPYKFVGDGKFWIERKNPDFINCNGEKIAIEVFYRGFKNGEMGDGRNLEQWKTKREQLFNKYGWKILFFDETQVNEEEIRRRLLLQL